MAAANSAGEPAGDVKAEVVEFLAHVGHAPDFSTVSR